MEGFGEWEIGIEGGMKWAGINAGPWVVVVRRAVELSDMGLGLRLRCWGSQYTCSRAEKT